MITTVNTKISNGMSVRRLLVTMAVSAPLIFLVIVFFS